MGDLNGVGPILLPKNFPAKRNPSGPAPPVPSLVTNNGEVELATLRHGLRAFTWP
jgi:hypothetical protein